METSKVTIGRMTLRQQELEDQAIAATARLNKQSQDIAQAEANLAAIRQQLEHEKEEAEQQLRTHAAEVDALKQSLVDAREEGDSVDELQEENDNLRLLLQAATIEYAKLWAARRSEAQDALEAARLKSLESAQTRSQFDVVLADNIRLQKDLKEEKSALRELRRAELEERHAIPCDCQLDAIDADHAELNDMIERDLRDELAVAELKRRHHKLAQVYAAEQLQLARSDVGALEKALEEMRDDYLDLKQKLTSAQMSASSEERQREDLRCQILMLSKEKERAIADEEDVRSEYASMAEQVRVERERQDASRAEISRLIGDIRVKESALRSLEEQVSR